MCITQTWVISLAVLPEHAPQVVSEPNLIQREGSPSPLVPEDVRRYGRPKSSSTNPKAKSTWRSSQFGSGEGLWEESELQCLVPAGTM